ncbi:MAG: nucleoside recognition protein [Methanosarcinaceae archaeon]|nr:nucleoside recognition protein [Methanosarcinaceae archaeon]MDF1533001.1 nucleoside recognition protein [Methanosarcinaceae archaeon]
MLTNALADSINYLAYIVPYMVVGVILAELFVELGWIKKVGFLVLPLTKFAHLRNECGVSFLTAFASPAAANASLKHLYDKKLIDERELIISSILNSFPSIIMHWRTLLPVLVPLLGVTGLIYIGLLTLVGFIKTIVVLFVGHFMLDKKPDNIDIEQTDRPSFSNALRSSITRSKKTLARILVVMIPTTIVVFILIDLGLFDTLGLYLQAISEYLPVPASGLPIIAAQFASKIAAYTIAGNMLTEGILSSRDIIVTLMVGKILSSVTTIRVLAPYYMGIFGPRLGLKVMFLSALLREGILIVITVLLILFY